MDDEITNLKKQIADLQEKLDTKGSHEHPDEPLNTEETEEFSWNAPVRIFAKWDRRKIVTLLFWSAFPALLLVYLHEYILLITMILFVIVAIALVTVPPNTTTHKITNKGIKSFGKNYIWTDLKEFWICTKNATIVLYVQTKLLYPSNIMLIVPKESLQGMLDSLSKHLKYREIREQQGILSKWTDGIYVKYNDLKSLETSNSIV